MPKFEDAEDEVDAEDIREELRERLNALVDEYVDGFYADDIAEAVWNEAKGQLDDEDHTTSLFIEYLELKRKESQNA